MADILRSVEASLGSDLKKLQDAQDTNVNSIDDTDYEIAMLLGKMASDGNQFTIDITKAVEIDQDVIDRVEMRNSAPPGSFEGVDFTEGEVTDKNIKVQTLKKQQAASVRDKQKKRKLLGNILGSKDGLSKKDLKKYDDYIDRAVSVKKTCDGLIKMIQISKDMPEKSTPAAIMQQRMMLKKQLEDLDLIKMGLDAVIDEGLRSEEQQTRYDAVWVEDWEEHAKTMSK
eukprot:Pgem_evm1s6676